MHTHGSRHVLLQSVMKLSRDDHAVIPHSLRPTGRLAQYKSTTDFKLNERQSIPPLLSECFIVRPVRSYSTSSLSALSWRPPRSPRPLRQSPLLSLQYVLSSRLCFSPSNINPFDLFRLPQVLPNLLVSAMQETFNAATL